MTEISVQPKTPQQGSGPKMLQSLAFLGVVGLSLVIAVVVAPSAKGYPTTGQCSQDAMVVAKLLLGLSVSVLLAGSASLIYDLTKRRSGIVVSIAGIGAWLLFLWSVNLVRAALDNLALHCPG